MALIAKKIDEYSIRITKDLPAPEPQVNTYDRGFIDSQILAVLAQKQKDNDTRDAELAELYGIRDEMNKLGIVAKIEPIQPIEKEL